MKVEDYWYRLEFLNADGKWVDAGDCFEEETKKACERHITKIDFQGHKVRVTEHFHAFRPIGKVIDMRNSKHDNKTKT